MVKRLFDVGVATLIMMLCLPLLIVAALGIRISSPGPILYRAKRTGLHGRRFDMLKLRSMHVGSDRTGPITTTGDRRIFAVGAVLRKLKIDELPQFINVLLGDMSIVGPRPEDPAIVERSYTPWMRETLSVRPGITSPGALFYYAYCDHLVDPDDAETTYLARLLPPKLAIERSYIDRATFLTDLGYFFLTALAVPCAVIGIRVGPMQRDLAGARRWLTPDVVVEMR